jgi:hypothetical protein
LPAWNIRALDLYEELKQRVEDTPELIAWRQRLVARADFPHKEVGWEPSANYGTTARAADRFDGMHGDEMDGLDEEEDEDELEEDEVARDWAEAGATTLRPCPTDVLAELRKGDEIMVYFTAPYSAWFKGTVDKVDRRCKSLPVFATFADGPARLHLDPDCYGVTRGKQWALLPRSVLQLGGLGGAGGSANRVIDVDDD